MHQSDQIYLKLLETWSQIIKSFDNSISLQGVNKEGHEHLSSDQPWDKKKRSNFTAQILASLRMIMDVSDKV